MTPTRNARWSYPVTMCFAPRYIKGPIAAPLIDCRNSASLPDTPCASATDEQTAIISIAVAPIARRFLGCMLVYFHSLAPGPHPRRELTPMLRLGFPCPRLCMVRRSLPALPALPAY